MEGKDPVAREWDESYQSFARRKRIVLHEEKEFTKTNNTGLAEIVARWKADPGRPPQYIKKAMKLVLYTSDVAYLRNVLWGMLSPEEGNGWVPFKRAVKKRIWELEDRWKKDIELDAYLSEYGVRQGAEKNSLIFLKADTASKQPQ